ncbi:cell shape determination protein CcmA [Pelobium manganitolerans]|uniref:Cell shape determination protein CcmA n=1 Tax=Pelobium manganitolerans TaxID=1842495 RepID=A0A419SC60_9SPHI|nr:cell shape determination protein CcmA [Pelobium manganitolerans]RKD20226.1 cell shape determination protein CcmA [Pelobium manganitolerans]
MKTKIQLFALMFAFVAGITLFSSCEKDENGYSEASGSPSPGTIDPGQAAGNEVLTLTGSGIGGVTSVIFEKDSVEATFNPNFNTESAIIFRVPSDAIPGQQSIIFKNSKGVEFKVPFKVLGLPAVLSVSNYNFVKDGEIVLTGKNLGDVSSVVFQGTTTPLTVVSKTATTLTLKMPETTFAQAKLEITNEAGKITTTQEFVNLDNAFHIFTDAYGAGIDNGSWGPAEITTTVAKTGTSSFKAGYNKGNWSADGFANWGTGIEKSADFKYFSFWVKGADRDLTFYITGDKKAGGDYGNSDRTTPITVPANVWTYFKLKISDVGFWANGNSMQRMGWWIPGPDDADAVIYFDDVIFIK